MDGKVVRVRPTRLQNDERVYMQMYDLGEIGIPEVPLFGAYRSLVAWGGLASHTHEAVEICFQWGGRQSYFIDGVEYTLNAGDVFVTSPGESHSTGGKPQQRGGLYWMHLVLPEGRGKSFLGMTGRDSASLVNSFVELRRRLFPGGERLESLFERARSRLMLKGEQPSQLAVKVALLDLLIEVAQRSSATIGRASDPRIRLALEHLDKKGGSSAGITELSEVVGLTPSWFKVLFKREMGLPPAEYIMRRKIAKAAELLAQGLSITETTMRIGFSSTQYFATVFRRYYGVAPTVYARRQDKGAFPTL